MTRTRYDSAEAFSVAQELGIDGRSGMSKNQLVKALRSA